MQLSEAQSLCERLMEQHGLLDKGWRFLWNTTRKKAFGLCSSYTKTIELSVHLTAINEEHHVRDTVLHEIAHALVGSQLGHNQQWKLTCIAIGARPQRCTSDGNCTYKWTGICSTCKKVVTKKHRRPKSGRKLFHKACYQKEQNQFTACDSSTWMRAGQVIFIESEKVK